MVRKIVAGNGVFKNNLKKPVAFTGKQNSGNSSGINADTFVKSESKVAFTGNEEEKVEKTQRCEDALDFGGNIMKTEFIFLGAPGSGKGTQTSRLSKDLDIPHIDTGSMLRSAVKEGTENGKIAAQYMSEGKLVPAEVVIAIVKDRLMEPDCKNGFILDGFPRSVEQAEALDDILKEINKDEKAKVLAVNIDIPEDVLKERIVNRRSCADCGEIYNLVTKPPKKDEECDVCGGKLVQRKDDTEETFNKRMKTYKEETQPLIDYYNNKGMLVNINGNKPIDEIYSDIKDLAEEE